VLTRLVRSFAGGAAGSGRQYVSWIHEEDLFRIFARALADSGISGIYNATAPHPVHNAELMRMLRRLLHRPWSPPVPAPCLRIGGYIADINAELALTGQPAIPERLLEAGFEFEYPEAEAALAPLLARAQPPRTPGQGAR
jgi:NAD dependent epimerase/dehydratase family enzyme